jgi:hypothetical protein
VKLSVVVVVVVVASTSAVSKFSPSFAFFAAGVDARLARFPIPPSRSALSSTFSSDRIALIGVKLNVSVASPAPVSHPPPRPSSDSPIAFVPFALDRALLRRVALAPRAISRSRPRAFAANPRVASRRVVVARRRRLASSSRAPFCRRADSFPALRSPRPIGARRAVFRVFRPSTFTTVNCTLNA